MNRSYTITQRLLASQIQREFNTSTSSASLDFVVQAMHVQFILDGFTLTIVVDHTATFSMRWIFANIEWMGCTIWAYEYTNVVYWTACNDSEFINHLSPTFFSAEITSPLLIPSWSRGFRAPELSMLLCCKGCSQNHRHFNLLIKRLYVGGGQMFWMLNRVETWRVSVAKKFRRFDRKPSIINCLTL